MAAKRFLNDPGSASFPSSDQWTSTPLAAGQWKICGEVTGTNGFNARVRQPLTVEMTEDGEQMRVTFVKIGDRVSYAVADHAGEK